MLLLIDLNEQELGAIGPLIQGIDYKILESENLADFSSQAFESLYLISSKGSNDLSRFLVRTSKLAAFWSCNSFSEEYKVLELDPRYLGKCSLNANFKFEVLNTLSLINKNHNEKKLIKNKLDSFRSILEENISLLEEQALKSRKKYKSFRFATQKNFSNYGLQNFYQVGSSAGSEFSEVFHHGGGNFWINFSTDSYELSSEIIKEIESWLKSNNDLSEFIGTLIKLYERYQLSARFDLCALSLSNTDLSASGFMFGSYALVSTNKKNLIFKNKLEVSQRDLLASKFQLNFERSEKVLLISPGTFKNYEYSKKTVDLFEYCQKHLEQAKSDLADEVFVNLSSFKDSDFLNWDAYLSYLEVSENAILSVN